MQQFRFPGGLRLVKENEASVHCLVWSRRGFLQVRFFRSSLPIFVQREDLDGSSTIPC